jgi:hypothetical protein
MTCPGRIGRLYRVAETSLRKLALGSFVREANADTASAFVAPTAVVESSLEEVTIYATGGFGGGARTR